MRRDHFDALSGQPLHPTAVHALAASDSMSWADPAGGYHEAATARQLLEASRATVAAVVGVAADRVSFRRSGPDAAAAAVDLLVNGSVDEFTAGSNGATAIASAVERHVILSALHSACRGSVTQLPVDSCGVVDVDQLVSAIGKPPACAALQVANIELGSLQPLGQVIDVCRARSIPLLIDATGALGVVPIAPGWSALVADAAGWAGPREAAIVVAPVGQSGPSDTLGLPAIIACAAALDSVWRQAPLVIPRMREATAQIRAFVASQLAGALVLGPAEDRLPNVVSIAIPDVDASLLQSELDALGIAVASGSACADRSGRASHVLVAAGLITVGNIRMSLPWDCAEAAVAHLLAALPVAVQRARAHAELQVEVGSAGPTVTTAPTNDRTAVDALGLRCPAPIIKLGHLARTLEPGSIIELRTDDPAAPPDVQAWCRLSGADLISQDAINGTSGGWIHLLRLSRGSNSNASPNNSR